MDGVPDLAIRIGKGPAARGRADLDAFHAVAEQDGERSQRRPQRSTPIGRCRRWGSRHQMRADLASRAPQP